MSPSLVTIINVLLIYNQLVSCGAAQSNEALSSTNKQTASSTPISETKSNDTSGVDDILRDTFELLDSLDQRLTQVSNKTKSNDPARELRSLDDIERDLLTQGLAMSATGLDHSTREKLESRVSKPANADAAGQQQQVQAGSNLRIDDDERLTQAAEKFSSVRKSSGSDKEGRNDLLASATNNHHEHQIFSSLISPSSSSVSKKIARQMSTMNDDQLGQQTNLGKFDNNFTEKHIRFTLDMMQAIFASQSFSAKSNTIESFLISPVSIQLVLMMMHLGARGHTKRELSNTLHFLSPTSAPSPANLSTLINDPSSFNGPTDSANKNNSNNKLSRRHPQQQQQQQQHQSSQQKQVAKAAVGQQTLNNNVHEQFGAAMRQLLKDTTVARALTSANQIFLQKELPLAPQYEWAVRHYYGTELKQVDFRNQPENRDNQSTNSNASSANIQQMVNDWVERQTRGKISNFLTAPVPSSTLLMALNVLYYKGDWQYKFDPADTDPESWFTRTDGKTFKVPMMVNKLPLAHAHDPIMKTSVIELPYKAQRLGLFILLPDEVNGIFETMQMLNSTSFANLISMMRKPAPSSHSDPHGLSGGGINVRIPKFSIESSPRVSQILSQQLGLKTLFSPDAADLSGMFASGSPQLTPFQKRSSSALNQTSPSGEHAPPPQVGLDELLHKAVLQVHEQGSVAAAASATIVERVGLFNGQYFEADHPFLLFLMDKQTGLVLFSGVFAGPANPASSEVVSSANSNSSSSNSTANQLDANSRSPNKASS